MKRTIFLSSVVFLMSEMTFANSFQYVTEKGYTFELVARAPNGGQSWRDLATSIVWHDTLTENGGFRNPCTPFGLDLPTSEHYRTAEEHGFREILDRPAEKNYFARSSNGYGPREPLMRCFSGIDGIVTHCIAAVLQDVLCVGP